MSQHSYSRCWLHLTWGTLERERMLPRPARKALSQHYHEYAESKGIYMKINYVNSDHTHALIDLPTNLSIEQAVKLFKGESSHWINKQRLVHGHFSWGRGYGAFSVSHSLTSKVCDYIANQEEHHRRKTFAEELQQFVEAYGLAWREESDDPVDDTSDVIRQE